MVVEPSPFFFQVEPSEPVMVEPAAAELTKFLPLSEPMLYEPDEPEALSAPDEPEEDEPELLLLFLPLVSPAAVPAIALTAAAIDAPNAPIYFPPFPMRPSRWRMTANCSRVSGLCGFVPSTIPASTASFHASEA